MKTIARRVGVSKTTVHRALSNVGGINHETRERILKVAAELDYTPNNLARGLRSHKSATIGFVVTGLTNSFYSSILEGVESVSTHAGYSILVAGTAGKPSAEVQHLNVLREQRVDGMIIAPAHSKANVGYYDKLLKTGIPFVFMDRFIPEVDADYVVTDNFAGGYMAAKHLIGLGKRRIGFGTTPGPEMMAASSSERLRGAETALEEAGLQLSASTTSTSPRMSSLRLPRFTNLPQRSASKQCGCCWKESQRGRPLPASTCCFHPSLWSENPVARPVKTGTTFANNSSK